jgi:hypothetical protein
VLVVGYYQLCLAGGIDDSGGDVEAGGDVVVVGRLGGTLMDRRKAQQVSVRKEEGVGDEW